jgi:membrane protease YdiL (CAAX protease family)
MILGSAYMFVPMLTVLLIEKVIYKEKIKESMQISFNFNIWLLVAILIPPFLGIITLGVSLLFPDVTFTPDMSGMFKRYEAMLSAEEIEQMKLSFKMMPIHPFFMTLIQGLLAGISINALAGFGEELGWRGFMLREFRGKSFVKTSIVIGAIWGFWHAPLILQGHNYPQNPQIGVIMMVIWCILLSFLISYITIKAKSVIVAAVMHGVLNGTAGLAFLVIDGGNDLTVGVTGFAGFISLIIMIVGFYIYDTWISKERIMSSKVEWLQAK